MSANKLHQKTQAGRIDKLVKAAVCNIDNLRLKWVQIQNISVASHNSQIYSSVVVIILNIWPLNSVMDQSESCIPESHVTKMCEITYKLVNNGNMPNS